MWSKLKNKAPMLILLFSLVFCLMLPLHSYADDSDKSNLQEELEEGAEYSPLGNILYEEIKVVFSNPATDKQGLSGGKLNVDTLLQDSVDMAYQALNFMYSPGGGGHGVYSVLLAVGIVLLTINFIMDLSTKDAFNAFGTKPTVEMILKPIWKYLLSVIFVLNVGYIILFVMGISQGAYTQVSKLDFSQAHIITATDNTSDLDYDDVADKIMEMCGITKTVSAGTIAKEIISGEGSDIVEAAGQDLEENGIGGLFSNITSIAELLVGDKFKSILHDLEAFPLIIVFLLPMLITIICNALMIYVVLSRIVNLVLQGCLAPIAMADVYSDRSFRETRAWGYIKNFAGICFQSVVIALVILVSNVIILYFLNQLFAEIVASNYSVSSIGGWASFAIEVVILKCVQVGAVFGSLNKAKEVFQ